MKRSGSFISELVNLDVLFGILLGVAAPFLLVAAMQVQAIEKWQELFSGVLALIGGAGTVMAVMSQIRGCLHTLVVQAARH